METPYFSRWYGDLMGLFTGIQWGIMEIFQGNQYDGDLLVICFMVMFSGHQWGLNGMKNAGSN